jgi:hypothetical protein
MPKRSVTVRFESADVDALERIARDRRQATGDAVSVSDLMREAVAEYLAAQDEGDDKETEK